MKGGIVPDPMSPTNHREPGYAWVVVAVGMLCEFGAVGMGRFGYGMLLPAMQQALGMSNTEAGMLATANLVGYLLMSAVGGALATRFGPRVVIGVGMFVSGLGMALTGFVAAPVAATAWRAVTGVGTGGVNVPTMGLVPAWFRRSHRGRAAGIVIGGAGLALIVSGVLFPRILAAPGGEGWRDCWLLVGGLTLTLSLVSLVLLRNGPGEGGLIRRRGKAAESGPMTRVSTGGVAEAPASVAAPGAPTSAAPGGAGRPSPRGAGLNWRRVYRSGAVVHLGLVYFTYGFAYIIFMTFFTKRLVSDVGYTKEGAGTLFMLLGWLSLFCVGLWGWFSDRFGRRPALICVYAILTASLALFALTGSRVTVVLSAVLFGLSSWSVPAIMAATCADAVGPRMAPAALGLITLFFGVGQALAPTVAGAMADVTGNFSGAFWLAAAVGALGTVGALLLRSAGIGAAGTEEPAGPLSRSGSVPRAPGHPAA